MATGLTISIEILKGGSRSPRAIPSCPKGTWYETKMFAKKRYAEMALMKKTLAIQEELSSRWKVDVLVHEGAITAFLLDHDVTTHAKVLSYTTKQKRKEKAGKWELGPTSKAKEWKIMVTKATCMGQGFKTTKYERFIHPMGLWFLRANVIHPELKRTFSLDIIGMKDNPNLPIYSQHCDKGSHHRGES